MKWQGDLAQLLVAVWIVELLAVLILLLYPKRNPHGKEPASRVPDYVPDDWGGGDGYVERGPDPQAVDRELMSLLDPDGGGSPHETRPGGGVTPYDRDDEYPGWGIPDGDTQPAADPTRSDRGMEGQSP